jgi:hypothetical protein
MGQMPGRKLLAAKLLQLAVEKTKYKLAVNFVKRNGKIIVSLAP